MLQDFTKCSKRNETLVLKTFLHFNCQIKSSWSFCAKTLKCFSLVQSEIILFIDPNISLTIIDSPVQLVQRMSQHRFDRVRGTPYLIIILIYLKAIVFTYLGTENCNFGSLYPVPEKRVSIQI